MRRCGPLWQFYRAEWGACWRRQSLTVVYNFTVDKDHDYFVGQQGLLVHNTDPWDIWFSRDPGAISGSDTFLHGPWAGRTLDEAVAEAQELGQLPEGLDLNAAWVNEQMVAANNRTLWVAQQANLPNVPVNGLGDNSIADTVRKHLGENSPFRPPCE
jgi:hypothetical protein